MPQNSILPNPRTRAQKMAYYLALGNEPAYAATLAGYAITTVKAKAAAIARGKKVHHLRQVYLSRLGLLSDETLQDGLANLHRLMDAKSCPRTSLAATETFIRLLREQTSNPNRNF